MPIEIKIQEETTYYGNQPGSIGEAIVRRVFNTEDLENNLGIRVREDVVVSEKMLLVSMREFITRKRAGCGDKTNSGRPIFREKSLDVINLQIWDEICAEDFGGTVAELARKRGYDINNLEGTEIETLMADLYEHIWERDYQSIIQFGDTTIDQTKPAGDPSTWSEATKQDYARRLTLGTMNGFWKMVFDAVALDDDDPDKILRVATIPQTGALPANYVRDTLLPALYNGQSDLMDQVDDSEKVFNLSRDLYTNLQSSLQSFPTTGERAAGYYTDGTGDITYNSIPVKKNKQIAQKAAKPYAAGDPRTFTRRAYLTVKGGFQVGTDTHQKTQVMTMWYSRDTDLNNIQIRYKLGMNYLDGDVVAVAY